MNLRWQRYSRSPRKGSSVAVVGCGKDGRLGGGRGSTAEVLDGRRLFVSPEPGTGTQDSGSTE